MCNWLINLVADNIGVAAIIGAAWSFIVEMFPAFGDLSPITKRWVVLILCMGIPLAALALGVFVFACPGAAFNPESLATAIATGSAAFTASTMLHSRKL